MGFLSVLAAICASLAWGDSVPVLVRPQPAPAAARAPVVARSAERPASDPLTAAVLRIPGYRSHRPTRWVRTDRYGHYGATDLVTGTVYVSPRVPAARLDSVVRHEWAHVLTVRAYRGDLRGARAGTARVFGGAGGMGLERAADCMARELGASWTHYTGCSSPAWRAGARRLLAGQPV